MENKVFDEIYKDLIRGDINYNPVLKRFSFIENANGNFFRNDKTLFPSSNIFDETKREIFEYFYDFNLDDLKNVNKDNIEITPAKINDDKIEKGKIEMKIVEKQEEHDSTNIYEIIDILNKRTPSFNAEPTTKKKEDNIKIEEVLNYLENKKDEGKVNEMAEPMTKEEIEIKNRERTNRIRKELEIKKDIKDNEKFLAEIFDKNGNRVYSDEFLKSKSYYELEALATDVANNMDKEEYYNIINRINDNNYRKYLYGAFDNNGVRIYSDEDIKSMNDEELADAWRYVTYGKTLEEIEKIKNRAEIEEVRRKKINNTPKSANLEELIEKYKEQITKETPIEEAKLIIDRINDAVVELYKQEQEKFEIALKDSHTVETKLDIIEKREERLKEYQNYYNFEQELNPETISYVKEKKKEITDTIKNEYNNKKQNGEYCWKEFDKVNESKKYIDTNIKDDLKKQFNDLTEKMFDIVKNPNQEQYDNWKNNMNEFVNNANLDREKIIPFLTAELRIKNPDKEYNVDKNFDIDGLNLTKTKTTEQKPIKKRAKVKKVEKGIGAWFKRHKNKLLLIGIGLAITCLLVYQIPTVQMMINSALWGAGKASGALTAVELNNLHSMNLGIAKVAQGGKYAFEAGSGLYTLAGKAGAQAMYSAGQAGLVNSLMNIAKVSSFGLIGSSVITTIIEKIQNIRKKKKGDDTIIEKPQDNEIVFGPLEDDLLKLFNDCKTVLMIDTTAGPGHLIATKDATDEQIEKATSSGVLGVGTYVVATPMSRKIIEEYNKKKTTSSKDDEMKETTPLTREQIAELIKKQVEESTKELVEENKKLKIENKELKQKLGMENDSVIKKGSPESLARVIADFNNLDSNVRKVAAQNFAEQQAQAHKM